MFLFLEGPKSSIRLREYILERKLRLTTYNRVDSRFSMEHHDTGTKEARTWVQGGSEGPQEGWKPIRRFLFAGAILHPFISCSSALSTFTKSQDRVQLQGPLYSDHGESIFGVLASTCNLEFYFFPSKLRHFRNRTLFGWCINNFVYVHK